MSKKENNADLELILEQLKKSYGENSDINNSISDEENDEFDDFGKRLSELLSQNHSDEQPSQSIYSFDMDILADYSEDEDENEGLDDLENIVDSEAIDDIQVEKKSAVITAQRLDDIEEIEETEKIEETEETEEIEEIEEIEETEEIEEIEETEEIEEIESVAEKTIIDIDAEFIKLGIPLVKEKNNSSAANTLVSDSSSNSEITPESNESSSKDQVNGVFDKMFANSTVKDERSITFNDRSPEDESVVDEAVSDIPPEDESVVDEAVSDIPPKDESVVDEVVSDIPPEDESVVDEVVSDIPPEDGSIADEIVENELLKAPSYTADPLQGRLSEHLKFTNRYALPKSIPIHEESQKEDDTSDISGAYNVDDTDNAGFVENEDKPYAPKRKDKKNPFWILGRLGTLYGYGGKEFTDRSQTDEIKKNYETDKRIIFIRMSGVAVISLILVFLELFFAFGNIGAPSSLFPMLEIFLVSLICIISYPELWKEIKRISKLDPGIYSPAVITSLSFYLYNIAMIMVIGMSNTEINKFPLFGFCTAIFSLCMLISEYTDCLRESKIFDTLSSEDSIYAAEKFNSDSIRAFSKNNTVKIKRAHTINGYFKKTSDLGENHSGFLPILIAAPIIALIVGFVSIIFKGNSAYALSDMTFSVFASVTVATPILIALPKFLCAKKLSEKKCAIIGTVAETDCAKIGTVIFDDREAVEVVKKVEIKPDKNADVKKSLRMAARVFSALGGPMAALFESETDPQEDMANISIISICDNGIELYMDSSVHVHIGDSDFFENCGIKIKTDGKIKSYLEAKRCGVLYVAFNKIPKLGYIVSEKIRRDFRLTAIELSQNDVKTLIQTYDPLINDIYLEQNKLIGNAIGIYKPENYDDPRTANVTDSGIIMLGDCKSIVYPITYCRDMLKTQRKNKIINYAISVLGMTSSLMLCAASCISDSFGWFENSKLVILLLFQVCTLIPLIPTLSEIFKKRPEKKQNDKENS